MARRPLWVSVTCKPVVSRVNSVAACSIRRRIGGRLGACPRNRLPSAKSARSRTSASVRREISDTRCWPSASNVTTNCAALRQRVVDAGLQRGALAEVEWMPDHDRAGRVRVIGRGVGGAVVDHDHRIARAPDLAHDAGKNGPFVVGRDDHIHLRPRDMFHLTLPRYGTTTLGEFRRPGKVPAAAASAPAADERAPQGDRQMTRRIAIVAQ